MNYNFIHVEEYKYTTTTINGGFQDNSLVENYLNVVSNAKWSSWLHARSNVPSFQ